jgi:hypothetical protein
MIENLGQAMGVIRAQEHTIVHLRKELARYTKELGTTPNKQSTPCSHTNKHWCSGGELWCFDCHACLES